jgi:hypothetical protein
VVRRFWMSLAVVLCGAIVVTTGVGVAAVEYGAWKWPGNWKDVNDAYHNGYVAGVMDTMVYTRFVGLSVNRLNSAWACQSKQGLTDVQVVKTVEAMLASNPKFEDNMAAAVITAMEGCKLAPPPASNVINKTNTLQKR